MKQKFLWLVVVVLFVACNGKQNTDNSIDLGESAIQYKSIDEYLNAKNSETINDSTWIKLMFLNNPYTLNESNLVSIYVNSHLVYRGVYKRHIELKGEPEQIFALETKMVISMEILTDKNKKTVWEHRSQSKTVFSWDENYKIIYCGFFPTNEDVEKVYFIPQIEAMI